MKDIGEYLVGIFQSFSKEDPKLGVEEPCNLACASKTRSLAYLLYACPPDIRDCSSPIIARSKECLN